MRSPLLAIAAAALALVAGGSAPPPDNPNGQAPAAKDQSAAPAANNRRNRNCFSPRFVTGFAAPDNRNLFVRVGVRDVFHFEMFAPCLDMDWNQQLGIVARPGPFICDGMDAEVISRVSGLRRQQRCLVRNMRKLTPEEIAALPSRSRP